MSHLLGPGDHVRIFGDTPGTVISITRSQSPDADDSAEVQTVAGILEAPVTQIDWRPPAQVGNLPPWMPQATRPKRRVCP